METNSIVFFGSREPASQLPLVAPASGLHFGSRRFAETRAAECGAVVAARVCNLGRILDAHDQRSSQRWKALIRHAQSGGFECIRYSPAHPDAAPGEVAYVVWDASRIAAIDSPQASAPHAESCALPASA